MIVPAEPDGIDQRYDDWLWYLDPDVIYSFVSLTDDAVAALHERYAPAFLRLHKEHGLKRNDPPDFRIELPVATLSSLSVLPAYAGRSRVFPGRPSKIAVLDKFWDNSSAPFVQENFGFLRTSLGNAANTATQYPELFTCTTLITNESFKNRSHAKDPHANYFMEEDFILNALGENGGPLTMAQLSEFFAPYLHRGYNSERGVSIVAGDAVADRLLFWNNHHNYERLSFGTITGLRIPADRLSDTEFLGRIRKILGRRGALNHEGQTDSVTLRSTSLDLETLEAAAEKLRKVGDYLAVKIVKDEDHAACIPRFRNPESVGFTWGGIFAEPEGRATTEFQGARVVVPQSVPWHMSEVPPPAGLRAGNWMVDLSVDRLADHCRYVNQRHVWALPRRIRMEMVFTLERETDDRHDYYGAFIRPARSGNFSLALNAGATHVAISIPDDIDAIRLGICNDREWLPFDRSREDAPHGRPRFEYADVSDKGRYLLGVLQLFEGLPDAFGVLMHGYWRDVLKHLGAEPVDDDLALRDRFIATLRKRFMQRDGPIKIESPEEMERLARVALNFGRMVRREPRYVTYSWLKDQWQKLLERELEAHPIRDGEDEKHWRDKKRLSEPIQYACRSELLFQGLEWPCQTCFNRNWVNIEGLGRTVECEVCGRIEAAPVAGDWHFRANPFVIEAYRQHGTEVLIWALWRLSERSRRSFYFAPSLRLWLQYPKKKEPCDTEIDALVVVEGLVYLVEATSATTLSEKDIRKLAAASELIRPDVLFVACGLGGDANQLEQRIRAVLPAGVSAEVVSFDPNKLERRPWLHC